jgi:hypothetical protein
MPYLLPLALLALLSVGGCLSAPKRTCTAKRCWIEGTQEQIDRACSKNGQVIWDSGEKRTAFDGKKIRCCVKLKTPPERHWIYVTTGEWACVVHEECHIEEYESGRKEHWRCNGFGSDPGKEKLPSHIERSK